MQRLPFVEIDGAEHVSWWRERFAPDPEPFGGARFYRRGKANVWIGTAGIDSLERARTEAVGLVMLRIGRRLWKPTSAAIIAFGSDSRSNVIDLEPEDARSFLAGESIALPEADPRRALLTRGFIAVRYRGVAIGCGEWQQGVLHSCLPKGRRVKNIDV